MESYEETKEEKKNTDQKRIDLLLISIIVWLYYSTIQ